LSSILHNGENADEYTGKVRVSHEKEKKIIRKYWKWRKQWIQFVVLICRT